MMKVAPGGQGSVGREGGRCEDGGGGRVPGDGVTTDH